MTTTIELKKLARARKIPKYYRMNKPQLMSALGMKDELKAHQRGKQVDHALKTQVSKLGEGDANLSTETKKALIKGRITRSIKRGLVAEEKKQGRKLTQDEKRVVAARSLASEVKAIQSGVAEVKPKRGNGQKMKPKEIAKRGIAAFKRRPLPPVPSDVANRGLNYVLDRDRQGWIRDAMAKGDEKMLRNRAKEAALNSSLQDAKHARNSDHYADAVVAAYKEKHGKKSEPAEQKIKLADVKTPEDKAKYAKQEAAHQRSLGNHDAAKAWDEDGKKARKTAIGRDITAKSNSQTNLFGVADHASDMPLFGGHSEEPAKKPSAPSGLAEVSPHDLNFDPKRFQYKMAHGAETGSSGSLTGVGKWDENLGGVMQIWRDPKDGKDYVVNGHNRATLARKLGAEKVAVRYLAVDTAHEARAIGALTNIAEGRGNSLDSAKFFRDSGITREDLEKKGIPMKEKIATDGLALSKLAPHLFDKVVQGDIPIERATLIGDRIHDHDSQTKLAELIDKAQSKGRKITNDVVRELADTVQSAPSHTETQFNLFGAEESTQNLALEKAELMAHVRSRLSREKKLFGLVSKSKAAAELQRGGNSIDTEKSKDISDQAGQVLGVFDQLKNQSGPVSTAINKATERIANGEDSKKVRDELHEHLLTEIPNALGIGKKSSAGGTQETSGQQAKKLRIKRNA